MRSFYLRWRRRGAEWLSGLALLGACFSLSPPRLQAAEPPVEVVDLHVDLPYQQGYKNQPFATGKGEFRARELLQAGVVGVVLPLFVPRQALPAGRTREQLESSYARVFRSILETPPYALPGCGTGRAGGQERSVSTWLAFEGADPLHASEQEVERWLLRGVRLFGLVHSEHNVWATSSGQPSTGEGLSPTGHKLAQLIAERGGILDVSHASDEATAELIAWGKRAGRPVVASHSNARALSAHPRNLTDEHIRGIASTGGVIGVNFHQAFLAPRGNQARLQQVVEQILHLKRVAGIEAIALGSDYEGGIRPVPELPDITKIQRLARALREAQLSPTEIEAIFSKNALRVLCGPSGPH